MCSCFVYHCLSFYLFFRTLFCLSFFALPYTITQITWRMRIVRQELLTIPGHQSSLSVFCRVRIAHYFAFCVVFFFRSLYICFTLIIVAIVFRLITPLLASPVSLFTGMLVMLHNIYNTFIQAKILSFTKCKVQILDTLYIDGTCTFHLFI